MKIETEFNEGDAVFVIKEKTVSYWHTCSTCGGTGVLYRANKEEIVCPICNGRTQISTQDGITHVIESGAVRGINIHIESYHLYIEYEIDVMQNEFIADAEIFSKNNVFATKEEAEKHLPKGTIYEK
jgi:acetyl-CoA carboxylase beta subunit